MSIKSMESLVIRPRYLFCGTCQNFFRTVIFQQSGILSLWKDQFSPSGIHVSRNFLVSFPSLFN